MCESCVVLVYEHHRRCSQPFNCGDQGGLSYPFWIPGRKDCGHPDFRLHCSSGFAELNISSVKVRILDVNYSSRIIKLARSNYTDIICPTNQVNAPFVQSVVLPFAPDTEMLTIYYHCEDLSSRISGTSIRELRCAKYDEDSTNYYETRNISSSLLDQNDVFNLRKICNSQVNIPASGSALNTLRSDNITKTLEQGFDLELNQDCSMCIESMGSCGYNQTSKGFVCYCNDGTYGNHCGSSGKKSHGKPLSSLSLFLYFLLLRDRV